MAAVALLLAPLALIAPPAAAAAPPPAPDAFAVGNRYACMRTTTGGVACWGEQPGAGSTPLQLEPTEIDGLASGVREVSAGSDHACAVTDLGEVWCWGANGSGALGDGSTLPRSAPVKVIGVSDAVAVAAGSGFTCALTGGGGVMCWGSDAFGQIGDGVPLAGTVAATTGATGLSTGVTAIAAGERHACALLEDGTIRCWGDGRSGELGTGQTLQANPIPVEVVGLDQQATGIAAGGRHTCAVLLDGSARCWGDNARGALGDGSTTDRPAPVEVVGLPGAATSMSLGEFSTCAVVGGAAWCWGMNALGVLGRGWTRTSQIGDPAPVAGLGADVTSVSVGSGTACATTTAGGSCWGEGRHGELATRILEQAMAPVPILTGPAIGAPTSVVAVPGDGSAHLSWAAPPGDGAAEVTGYAAVAWSGSTPVFSERFAGAGTTAVMHGLPNGMSLTVTVHAITGEGGGLGSTPSSPITPRPAPDAPTGVAARTEAATVVVSWTAPADVPDAPVTSYRITPHRGAAADPAVVVAATVRARTFTTLAVGTTYTFTVAAVNAMGVGHESTASSPVTAVGPPAAPTLARAAPRNAATAVSWAAPAATGATPITAYVVTPYRGATAQAARIYGASVRSATITGLVNGSGYTFRVKAVNAAGTGPSSAPTPMIVVGAPTAVATPTGRPGPLAVTLTWAAPFNNGSAITGYTVIPYLAGVAQPGRIFGPTSTTRTITGLVRGGAYTFVVKAANARGNGPASAASAVLRPT